MLFVPGNNPAMAKDVVLYGPDSIMFDLEDAIAITEKDAARRLTHHSLKSIRYDEVGIETVVRINSLDSGYGVLDLEAIVPAKPNVIRLPKTETAQDIIDVEREIERIEKEHGIEVGTIKMMAAIESPKGVFNAYDIAQSSERLIGIALGAEDYVTNMKTRRYPNGDELFFARSMILNAARACGLAALDTVYSDVNNDEGFLNEANHIRQLGFDGKSLIHPGQIDLINQVYTPTEKEIEKSIKIVRAARKALKEGKGVITVDGKMVDNPIIVRAEYLLELAKYAGLLEGVNFDEE